MDEPMDDLPRLIFARNSRIGNCELVANQLTDCYRRPGHFIVHAPAEMFHVEHCPGSDGRTAADDEPIGDGHRLVTVAGTIAPFTDGDPACPVAGRTDSPDW
jgi:hypothetical protein